MRIQTIGAIVGAVGLMGGLAAVGRVPFVQPSRMNHPVSGQPIVVPGAAGDATMLFNGWKITPAGRHLQAGDMLLGAALSPDGTTLAIANAGYNPHSLHLIDLASEKELARLPVDRAWNGIAWSPDGGRIYLSGGVENAKADVHVFEKQGDKWAAVEGLKLTGNDPKKTAIAGLAVSKDGSSLFVLNNSDDQLYVIGSADGASRATVRVGDHPGACRLSTDGKTLYVAIWGGANLAVVDVTNPRAPQVVANVQTGDHPNDIALSRDGRIFVSCGNSDSVTVIDTLTRKPIETIKTTFTPRTAPGATPNALALAQDNRTLYVANADNNNICVVDTSQRGASNVAGFVPSGWYPTAVAVTPDGAKIVVCSGKGMGTRPNPSKQPLNPVAPTGFEYIGRQLGGMISFVDAPNDEQLDKYTAQVRANTPYRDSQLKAANTERASAVPINVGDFSPIKYVLYIIKENRTYDQVFGDMGKGNGDPNLCLFGREVTPNHHALAEQYVLLDNLYCSGEVSADGHPWSTSAYATDFTQRSWTLSYSGHGGTKHSDSVAVPRAGYIWDACNRKGLTYRSYGEYVYASSSESAPEQKVAGAKGLIGHGSEK